MAKPVDTTNPPAVSPPVSEVERLRAELAQWPKWGVIEVMVRNPAVSEYIGVLEAELERLREMSAKMAEDDGLWFIAQTAPEAHLQQALRKLCAAIEGVSPEDRARAALNGDA